MEARDAVRRIRGQSHPLEPRPAGVTARLEPLPGLRAVLFDVYGTLFISAPGEPGASAGGKPAAPARAETGRARALGEAIQACGLHAFTAVAERCAVLLPEEIRASHARSRLRGIEHPEVDIRDVFHRMLRRVAREGLLDLPPARRDASGPDRGLCECVALEYECRVNPTWPMPGLRGLLEVLRRRGRLLGLVSNAQFYTPWLFPAHLGLGLKELGITRALCAWSYRLGEAKPSRAPFFGVLGRLAERGILPGSVLYVGNDRRNDVEPACALGCRTALFAGDLRSYRPRSGDPRLEEVQPDVVITSLDQLPPLLAP
jgi:putative hydrolase of the HAD superfamily